MREHYKANQEILEKMNKYIEIISNYDTKYNLKLIFKRNSERITTPPTLLLKVSKEPTLKNTFIRKRIRNPYDNETFVLKEDGDKLYFERFNDLTFENCFNPEILINNQSGFAEAYDELKNSKLFTLPLLHREINPYQILYIFETRICLANQDENHNVIYIEYVAENDNISIKANVDYSTYFIEMLFQTKIPKYELPDEYISLLEEKNDKANDLYIDDIIGKRKENLRFGVKRKKLTLTKNTISFKKQQ